MDKTQRISRDELALVLRALENDGILLDSLSFGKAKSSQDLAERIMREFDSGKSGYVCFGACLLCVSVCVCVCVCVCVVFLPFFFLLLFAHPTLFFSFSSSLLLSCLLVCFLRLGSLTWFALLFFSRRF
jgi:hypothetical protein